MKTMIHILSAVALAAVFALPMVANATALSADRYTTCKYAGKTKRYLMTASKTIYKGSFVMINSSGTAEAAAASASNNNVAGVAQEQVTSAASGDYYIKVTDETMCKFAGTTLEQDDVGKTVYCEDDQTVDETPASNEPVCGLILEYISASEAWVWVSSDVSFGRVAVSDPLTLTGDLTLAGGAGALTFTDSASSIVIPDNDATALVLGSTGYLSLLTFDTTNDAEEVNVVGKTAVSVFRVDTGFATFDEQAVLTTGASVNGAAAALVFPDGDERLSIKDNDSDSFGIGLNEAAGALMLFDTTDSNEEVNIVGTTATSAFRVDTGFATFDEQVIMSAGAAVTGDLTVLGSAASMGWTTADAANTACATTCAGTGACVHGIDSATHVFVACNNAIADSCLCAGPAS